jgi:hypothetical protein
MKREIEIVLWVMWFFWLCSAKPARGQDYGPYSGDGSHAESTHFTDVAWGNPLDRCVEIAYPPSRGFLQPVRVCVPKTGKSTPLHVADWGGSVFVYDEEGYVWPAPNYGNDDNRMREFNYGVR